jgi:hypothetical protein
MWSGCGGTRAFHRMRAVRITLATLALAFALGANAQQTFVIDGFLTARGVNADDRRLTWLERGPGKFDARGNDLFAVAQIGADWTPSEHFDAHVSGLARHEPSSFGGRRAGLTEAYVDASAGGFQLRLGQFFLPTSRENKGLLWTSPYTLSFSALNTWVGEEVRPIGADLQWKSQFYWTVGATAFRGNDTSGTLLAWRGWAMGSRLSVYDEPLPLPPLSDFPLQQDHTVPFSSDLDGRTGIAGRVRFSLPERANVQLTHFDNRGDRKLYSGQYSWQTRYNQLSGEIGSTSPTTFAAEYMWGRTGMGFAPKPHVQTDFDAWYALVTHKIGRNRFTARLENFTVTDQAHAAAGVYDDRGWAWTLAWLYDVTPKVRAGVEFVQITGRREDPYDARKVSLELRYALR